MLGRARPTGRGAAAILGRWCHARKDSHGLTQIHMDLQGWVFESLGFTQPSRRRAVIGFTRIHTAKSVRCPLPHPALVHARRAAQLDVVSDCPRGTCLRAVTAHVVLPCPRRARCALRPEGFMGFIRFTGGALAVTAAVMLPRPSPRVGLGCRSVCREGFTGIHKASASILSGFTASGAAQGTRIHTDSQRRRSSPQRFTALGEEQLTTLETLLSM